MAKQLIPFNLTIGLLITGVLTTKGTKPLCYDNHRAHKKINMGW
jgi:hypothetical protein